MAIPANLLISDLYQGIVNKFGGRSNLGPSNSDNALYVSAVRDAIRELTENNEFEELKVPSPIIPIQYGVLTYSISQFIPTSLSTTYDITDVFDWGFWLNPGSTNGPFRILKQRRVPTVNQYQFGTTAPAPPVYFSRFGSPIGLAGAGNELLVGPTPDNTYQSIMYFRARHPFVPTPNMYTSPIYLPDTWQEILEYSACLRLAMNEGSEKYVSIFRAILFGDPKQPDLPGILKARRMQMERDANHNERQISVATQLFSGHY
jgi:hypothetical protein